jgi:anti-sigma regulatory factor (Ser/Thr protein kinase)
MDAVAEVLQGFRSSSETVGPVRISDSSGVGEARRAAQRASSRALLAEADAGRVALVVTELATNLVKHAGGGTMFFQPHTDGTSSVLITAIDRGPGMDVQITMRDGHSSAGTSGNGLGAIRRMSDALDIHSLPGRGTIVVARIGPDAIPGGGMGVAMPLVSEEVCGDAWAVSVSGGMRTVLMVDGLGHGPAAAEAARAAVEGFLREPLVPVEGLLRLLHALLRPTRGAAVAVARIDERRGELRYGGVGNISASISGPAGQRSLISHNGILGHEARKFQELLYPWGPGSLLVLHSDGLTTQWKLDDMPGLRQRDAATIAALLVRDFARGRDDASAFVLHATEGPV